jgi:hypothetical protein
MNLSPRPARCGLMRSRSPIEQARMRLTTAKATWADTTIAVAQRKAGAAARVPVVLADLLEAFAELDLVMRTGT